MILPSDCNLPEIGDVHRSLSEHLKRSGDITLDASHIESADISLVQLMISTSNSAAIQQKCLYIVGLSTSIHSLFERTGLSIDPAGKLSHR